MLRLCDTLTAGQPGGRNSCKRREKRGSKADGRSGSRSWRWERGRAAGASEGGREETAGIPKTKLIACSGTGAVTHILLVAEVHSLERLPRYASGEVLGDAAAQEETGTNTQCDGFLEVMI